MSCSNLIADSGNQFDIVPLTFSMYFFSAIINIFSVLTLRN